jgi:hypothetical protein
MPLERAARGDHFDLARRIVVNIAQAAGATGGKSRFLQAAKVSLTLQAATARLMLQAAKPSLTLQVAKASLTVLRSSRHRRPQRPKRNRAALPSVRDSNTSIHPHPTTSRPDRRATRDASDHPSTRVDHDKRGRPMFACVVGFAPRACCAARFAPPARWAAGIYPRIDRAPPVARRRKTTVQLASTPVQGLSDRLALSSAFLNAVL